MKIKKLENFLNESAIASGDRQKKIFDLLNSIEKDEMETLTDTLTKLFGYNNFPNYYKLQERRLYKLIDKYNKLKIGYSDDDEKTDTYKNKLIKELKLESLPKYSMVEKVLEKHFTTFKSDDKIKELVDRLYVSYTNSYQAPYNLNDDKSGSWKAFYDDMKKYTQYIRNLKFKYPDNILGERFYVYDLRKDFIKFNLPTKNKGYEYSYLSEVLDILNGGYLKDSNGENLPSWKTIPLFTSGVVTIKTYASGTCDVSGILAKKLRPYIIEKLSKNLNNIIITK